MEGELEEVLVLELVDELVEVLELEVGAGVVPEDGDAEVADDFLLHL